MMMTRGEEDEVTAYLKLLKPCNVFGYKEKGQRERQRGKRRESKECDSRTKEKKKMWNSRRTGYDSGCFLGRKSKVIHFPIPFSPLSPLPDLLSADSL